jgi:hypothetical protein
LFGAQWLALLKHECGFEPMLHLSSSRLFVYVLTTKTIKKKLNIIIPSLVEKKNIIPSTSSS